MGKNVVRFLYKDDVMRTNIEIADELMTNAMRMSKSTTKKETVRRALEAYIQLLKRKKILALQGGIEWLGDLDGMRSV